MSRKLLLVKKNIIAETNCPHSSDQSHLGSIKTNTLGAEHNIMPATPATQKKKVR